MGIAGATTDTFILFENGVRRNRLVPELSNAADHAHSCACRKLNPGIHDECIERCCWLLQRMSPEVCTFETW
jgi:hypothetical protein